MLAGSAGQPNNINNISGGDKLQVSMTTQTMGIYDNTNHGYLQHVNWNATIE